MRRPIVLVIRDGWGIGDPGDPGNAVALARKPNLDRLMARHPHTRLGAGGLDVGLTAGSQGSSEVGHLNMGAGRIVYQEITRISKSIEDRSFFANPRLRAALDHCLARRTTLHVIGLVQDQGVHAHEAHLYALLRAAKERGLSNVVVHFVADGRDTPPRSALVYLERLEAEFRALGLGSVGSVMGRYYAMDRDRNWERTRIAYRALLAGEGLRATSAREAIRAAYARADATLAAPAAATPSGAERLVETDEFVRPTLIAGPDGSLPGIVRPGDALVFFNYRQDRAVQLSMAFVEEGFTSFDRGPRPDVFFLGFTCYYDDFRAYMVPPMSMARLLAEVLSERGLWQLRISETQKFRHVTSYFNGKREAAFRREDRVLVASYKTQENLRPEMRAPEVTDAAIVAIRDGILATRRHAGASSDLTLYEAAPETDDAARMRDTYDVVILNYPNADMVGHTGDLAATVRAVEVLDGCIGRLADAVLARDGVLLVTSDHGNAECMIDPSTGGAQTSHTANDVDLTLVARDDASVRLRARGTLSDVAPTILDLLGIEPPQEMTATSLLVKPAR